MSKSVVHACDWCGKTAKPPVSFRVRTGRQPRLIAEQSLSELEIHEEVDLCPECAGETLGGLMAQWTEEQGKAWVEALRARARR